MDSLMKSVALFGGTGGLGSQLVSYLEESYNVTAVGSKQVDITNYDAVKTFFSNNEIDIVINLSGYNYDSFLHKYTEDTYSEISRQIEVNIKGTINVASCALSQMRDREYGRLILLSSVLADHPVVSTSIYSGCKGFVDSFTKTVAIENIGKGITCNSIQLGYFDGGLTHRIPEAFKESIRNGIPAKRWGSIQELYSTVDYMIKTPYLTGQNINISGGII